MGPICDFFTYSTFLGFVGFQSRNLEFSTGFLNSRRFVWYELQTVITNSPPAPRPPSPATSDQRSRELMSFFIFADIGFKAF